MHSMGERDLKRISKGGMEGQKTEKLLRAHYCGANSHLHPCLIDHTRHSPDSVQP